MEICHEMTRDGFSTLICGLDKKRGESRNRELLLCCDIIVGRRNYSHQHNLTIKYSRISKAGGLCSRLNVNIVADMQCTATAIVNEPFDKTLTVIIGGERGPLTVAAPGRLACVLYRVERYLLR